MNFLTELGMHYVIVFSVKDVQCCPKNFLEQTSHWEYNYKALSTLGAHQVLEQSPWDDPVRQLAHDGQCLMANQSERHTVCSNKFRAEDHLIANMEICSNPDSIQTQMCQNGSYTRIDGGSWTMSTVYLVTSSQNE